MDLYLTLESGTSVTLTYDEVSEMYDLNYRLPSVGGEVIEWTLSLTGAQCMTLGRMLAEGVEAVKRSGPVFWHVGVVFDPRENGNRE